MSDGPVTRTERVWAAGEEVIAASCDVLKSAVAAGHREEAKAMLRSLRCVLATRWATWLRSATNQHLKCDVEDRIAVEKVYLRRCQAAVNLLMRPGAS